MQLSADEVHLWLTDPGDSAVQDRFEDYRRLLCADELKRLGRFAFEKDRLLYLVSRAQIRCVLSLYEKVEPQDWRFRSNRFGRPEIADGEISARLRFNISHTEGMTVSAVARGVEVGVDVENWARREALMEVAESVFTTGEFAALGKLKGESRRRRFFELWTLKEAYVKARGQGLSIPLRRFAFDLSETLPAIRVEFDAELGEAARDWQFQLLRPTGEHQVGLAILKGASPDKKVTVRRFLP